MKKITLKKIIVTLGCVAVMLVWNSVIYVPAGKVETASVSSTNDWYDDHTHIIRKDGCEYVIFSGPEQGGITHHGACDNFNCNFKK